MFSGKQAVTLWYGNRKPNLSTDKERVTLKVYNGNFQSPVWVDLRTGGIFELPENTWNKEGNTYYFNQIPVYDSPVLIIDKSLILWN